MYKHKRDNHKLKGHTLQLISLRLHRSQQTTLLPEENQDILVVVNCDRAHARPTKVSHHFSATHLKETSFHPEAKT